jgi:hypothetical protein
MITSNCLQGSSDKRQERDDDAGLACRHRFLVAALNEEGEELLALVAARR